MEYKKGKCLRLFKSHINKKTRNLYAHLPMPCIASPTSKGTSSVCPSLLLLPKSLGVCIGNNNMNMLDYYLVGGT